MFCKARSNSVFFSSPQFLPPALPPWGPGEQLSGFCGLSVAYTRLVIFCSFEMAAVAVAVMQSFTYSPDAFWASGMQEACTRCWRWSLELDAALLSGCSQHRLHASLHTWPHTPIHPIALIDLQWCLSLKGIFSLRNVYMYMYTYT